LQGIISGSADLVKVGAGTLNLIANNTYTGNTIVNSGTLQLTGSSTQAGGTILNTTGITVNPGATFFIDNSSGSAGGNLANRVSDTAPITLNAGTLQYQGNPGGGNAPLANSEQLGPITIGQGGSIITTSYNAAPAFGTSLTLTAASLTRQPGGTV